jgi:transcriptional regulator with XRE-family HTH domain
MSRSWWILSAVLRKGGSVDAAAAGSDALQGQELMTSQVMDPLLPRSYAGQPQLGSSAMTDGSLGGWLREWRASRRLSQMALALEVGVSTRHLSCIETAKSRPSRELVARLAAALGMSLRERNGLMLAAGYAPEHPESPLATGALRGVRQAIDLILAKQEPYPAFVLDRHWNILGANLAAMRVNRYVLGGRDSLHNNMLRQLFDPQDLRAACGNWDEIAGELLRHLHDKVSRHPADAVGRDLLRELLAYPGVPRHWRHRTPGATPSPLLTTELYRGDHRFRFFSTITTFGMPGDVTVEEIHIESCFAVDEETALHCRRLAEQGSTAQ